MAEEFQLEILVITLLMIMSFASAHVLRKYNIIWLPESLIAVVLSMLMALVWWKVPGLSSGLSFNNETFFLVLLPFIIFESGFEVHRQSLFRNMGSILMFAIIGTFLSAFGIGGFLYATVKARGAVYDFSFLDCMIIGAIMSSTDPVATLSIFSKLDVDRMTYSLVFGESMLNDAVSIVSFKTLGTFYSTALTAASFFKAVGMFVLIFVGALVIGMLMAALVSLVLRRTDIGRNHKPMEVTFVVGGAYLAYFVSDFANLSGIVSIFFYGVASRHYTYYTLSEESQRGTHWIFEAIKEVCEMLVFVLLGVTILQDSLKYDFYLITMTSLGCLLARLVATGGLSLILNIKRPESDRISWKSQIVIWNAGLRGAVAYALAVSHMMPKVNMTHTNLMITTVHASVIFTIIFHGLLTFPIVWLTGLRGGGVRQLSEPRAARQKMHSLWSRIDKTYIIPFISFARPTPEAAARAAANANADTNGLELDERDSSIDMPRSGRFSYDGMEGNPQGLDTSLFAKRHMNADPDMLQQLESGERGGIGLHDSAPRLRRSAIAEAEVALDQTENDSEEDTDDHVVRLDLDGPQLRSSGQISFPPLGSSAHVPK